MRNVADIDSYVRRFCLYKALGEVGRRSFDLFDTGKPFKNYPVVINGKNHEHTVTQWGLANIAYRLIESSNDSRSGTLDFEELMRASSLFNELHEPFENDGDLLPFFLRISSEQFPFQENIANSFARHYELLVKTPDYINDAGLMDVPAVFERVFGLPIDAYLLIGFAIGALCKRNPFFHPDNLVRHRVEILERTVNEDTVKRYMEMASASYQEIRSASASINRLTIRGYERYQFNPLFRFPIVKADPRFQFHRTAPYVIPNIALLTAKTSTGIYWALRDHFLGKDSQEFTSAFGKLFEHYVGRLLKDFFGDDNVSPEIDYAPGMKSVDWLVLQGETLILVECKASLLPLMVRQTFSKGLLKSWLDDVIVKGIRQLCVTQRLIEERHPEFARFHGAKSRIKLLVTYENLYNSGTSLFKSQLENLLNDADLISQYPDAANTHILRVSELESLESVLKQVPVNTLFEDKKNYDMDFIGYVLKAYDAPLQNEMLEKTWETFFSQQLLNVE